MKQWVIKFCGFLVACQVGIAGTALASEDAGHGHDFHSNTMFGFFGITGEDRRDHAPVLAIEYERRFSERWGLSVGLEHAFGDQNFTVVTVPLIFHSGNWGFYGGPGVESHDGHHGEFLVRFGVVYEFEVGNVILAPKFNVDLVDGDTVLVGGLAIGFPF